ncbi:DMT family transporter [Alphaproteobacteria bacterium]|nr:DMT family transporter [Alphaproteobacteria bacterium]
MFKNTKIQSILWVLMSKSSFVAMMTIVKLLKYYSPLQLNFVRSFLVLSVLTPYILKTRGFSALKTKQPFLQVIRMFFSAGAMICFFYGYRILPISKASAINFSYALIVPLFAGVFLREKISWSRWGFLILGYIGVLIIINPVFETFEYGELIALVGVILLSSANILVKTLTKTDENLVLVFYSGVATSFLLGGYFVFSHFCSHTGLPEWKSFGAEDGMIFILLGALSFAGQFSYVQAYRTGQLNFLAGFDYVKFLLSAIVGFFLFNETLESTTFYGALIILVCSYAITKEELRKKK